MSLFTIFDYLKLWIQCKIDILVIIETKTDLTFLLNQFGIQSYSKPYMFNRNRYGSGVFKHVREDISSRELKIHNIPEDIESTFIKTNVIKTKWLFWGYYDLPSQSDQYFFKKIGKELDKYSKHYNKFMLVGDFNAEESKPCLSNSFMNTIPTAFSRKALVFKIHWILTVMIFL